MAQFKTAISIDDSVFAAMEDLANRMSISRSRAFELAARQFVKHYREEAITSKLNKVYGDSKDKKEDDELLEAMLNYQGSLLENFD